MQTTSEFFERLRTDKAFYDEFGAKLTERLQANDKPYLEVFAGLGAEYGYDIKDDELKELEAAGEDLSEEELGKVSGGLTPFATLSALVSLVSIWSAATVVSHIVEGD